MGLSRTAQIQRGDEVALPLTHLLKDGKTLPLLHDVLVLLRVRLAVERVDVVLLHARGKL